ncbi:MAG: hypothetical protein HQL51_08825 [Magnetococcales bacterium]|nr:hypothetical protein [Magnetococcales bacterium]
MDRESQNAAGAEPFAARLNGRFDGVIRQEQIDELGSAMARSDGWYLVQPGDPYPAQPVSGSEARCHLEGLVDEILRVEQGTWSTMIYAQSLEAPEIIKVFHPRRAGSSCGSSGQVIRPWRVLTRIPPGPVPDWEAEAVGETGGRGWWKKLL